MPSSKPKKPKGAGRGGERAAQIRSAALAGGVALLAVVAGCMLYVRSGPPTPASSAKEWSSASLRLGEPSPTEAHVADACAAIIPLFSADVSREALSCSEFLRSHWEQAPLLSTPGAEWNQALMRLDDVAKMIGSWPIKFFKNHATAAMHKPASGFQADHKWQRGEMVPANAVEIAMEEQRTLVMHNLEVYW